MTVVAYGSNGSFLCSQTNKQTDTKGLLFPLLCICVHGIIILQKLTTP